VQPSLRFMIIAAAGSAAGAAGGLVAILISNVLARSGHGGGSAPLAIWFVLVVSFGICGALVAQRWVREKENGARKKE
jgi:hypothetical protein